MNSFIDKLSDEMPISKETARIGVAVDIAVWTPSEGEINMVRIGDGEDRKVILR